MLDLCTAVSIGNCSLVLPLRNPGYLSHRSYLTLANYVLTLYEATKNPTGILSTLDEYTAKVCVTVYFNIKSKRTLMEYIGAQAFLKRKNV